MPKIKLKPEDNYRYAYTTTVKVRDINYGGHLGNDALVGILQEARVTLLHDLGLSELDLGDGETGIIMNELAVSYRAEGRLHDEIVVHTEFTDVKAASFRMAHKVTRGEDTLALAEVGIVSFNYKEGSIAPVPESFLEKIGR